MDLLIAVAALEHGAALLTRSARDFDRVPALLVKGYQLARDVVEGRRGRFSHRLGLGSRVSLLGTGAARSRLH
jgi:hypothetical protein